MSKRLVEQCVVVVALVSVLSFPSVCSAQNTVPESILTIPYISIEWNGTEMSLEGRSLATFYPALTEFYRSNMLVLVKVNNTTDNTLEALAVEAVLSTDDDIRMQGKVSEIEAYPLDATSTITETQELNLFPLPAKTIDRAFLFGNRTETMGYLQITVHAEWDGRIVHKVFEIPASIQSLNAFDAANAWMLSGYINASQPEVVGFVRQVLSNYPEATENWEQAAIIFDALAFYGMRYQRDPNSRWTSGAQRGLDTVFLPVETLSYRQGDCDDLSVLYATALESVGIPTRLVFAPQHVWVAFAPYDVELTPDELRKALHMQWDDVLSDYSFDPLQIPIAELYGRFDDGYLWIPVETTLLKPPEYSFLGVDGIGWVRNNFTAAVEAGRKQMRVADSELESYRTEDIQRNVGLHPASLTPQVNTISALPDVSELKLLYQTEKWHSASTHVGLFMRRNWFWAIPALLVGLWLGWRTLNALVGRLPGSSNTKPGGATEVDPDKALEESQVHVALHILQEYRQCPCCGVPFLHTTLECPSCGVYVCRCGGIIHMGTRKCQRCGQASVFHCPQCGTPIQPNRYDCAVCNAELCTECSGIVDMRTMKCTRCGQEFQRLCPECNAANDPSVGVCVQCGHQLMS
jgi:hypothetical protein